MCTGGGIDLLEARLFILLAILKFTCSFHAKTKNYSKHKEHKNPAFQPTALVTDGHNSLFPQSSWSFVCINMTSTYPSVWKHSGMPFCIQPLLGTRYHCSLSGSCVMLRKPGENWDVELLSRNLIQNSFPAVECWACPTKDLIQQCYHSGIYLDVQWIPLRQ